ncbi:MAG: prephenate dehydrogenase/arogenate dehydrogenase family protein [Candidatus Rokuibacteriota bacterium]
MIERLAVVGLGLLGGSVAKAARTRGLARRIVGVARNPAALEAARDDGTVDLLTSDLGPGLAEADLCVLATPVAVLESMLPAVWQAAAPHAMITDVGSTKARIVARADALAATRPLRFVGSHPMAGSERTGYAVARADLFEGATVVLTPSARTDAAALARVGEFWLATGARLVRLDPASHDRAVAAVSHLPHLVADALVDAVIRMDPAFFDIAGRGLKDTTRIAAASPPLWREIFQDNREALGEALGAFRKGLDHLEGLLAAGDGAALEQELDRIKRAREQLG